jgi:hypothetical protein
MALTRALLVALSAALAAGLLAGGATAARPTRDHQLATAHFIVSYDTDPLQPDYTTETQAGDIAAYAERMYSVLTSWGYAAPPPDFDGKIDIYVTNLLVPAPQESEAVYEGFTAPSTGYIELAPMGQLQGYATSEGLDLATEVQRTLAASLFYLMSFRTWVPDSARQADEWLLNGADEWAGLAAIGFPSSGPVLKLGNPDIALTCRDNLAGHQMCDPDSYVEEGFARWAFFQQLANQYGMTFVQNAFANANLGQGAETALSNAIAAKGGSLTSQFNNYAKNLMSGNFGVAALSAVRPPVHDAVVGGTTSAALPTIKVPVNHLSARYVTFQRGHGDGTSPCYAATLSISVAMPAGTSAQPYYFWDVPGSTTQALAISGNRASITVPWDTCDWGAARGWLSMPNASTTVDAADFTVTSSVTVDTNTPASAINPPTPASVWGTTVPVPTSDVPPSIDVFGPELLQLSASDPTIRLIVDSSGPGMLTATLGSTVLGTGTLRSGNNDLRFAVPKGMLTSLRRSAIDANILTLTPASPTGSATGAPVMLHVAIAPAPTAKKAAKHPKHPKHKKT